MRAEGMRELFLGAALLLPSAPASAQGWRAPARDVSQYEDRLPDYADSAWQRPAFWDEVISERAPESRAGLVRAMPYPFSNAFTITSDADMDSISTAYIFRDWLQRRFALNVAQSFFFLSNAEWPGGVGPSLFRDLRPERKRMPVKFGVPPGRSDMAFLDLVYSGAFDFLHTYGVDNALPIPLVASLSAEVGGSGFARASQPPADTALPGCNGLHLRVKGAKGVARLELFVETPDGAVFRAPLPVAGSAEHVAIPYGELQRRTEVDGHLVGTERMDERPRGANAIGIDVWGDSGSRAEVEDVRCIYLERGAVRRQLLQAASLGVTTAASVVHGGYTGQAAHSSFEADGTLRVASPYDYAWRNETIRIQRRASADDPTTPFFHTDLLETIIGVEFFDDGDKIRIATPIGELVRPRAGPDGRSRYRFHRHSGWLGGPTGWDPRVEKGAGVERIELADPEAAAASVNRLGGEIEYFIRSLRNTDGRAVILYTHYSSVGRMPWAIPTGGSADFEANEDRPFGDRTRRGWELLQALHYNPLGELAPFQRIWVTSLPVLLRFALVQGQIREHARVDFEASRVEIESWVDPVLERRIPTPAAGVAELHGQTFYVRNPFAARVFLDAREITSFKRNPPDHTGRASVTLVDDANPIPILDEVEPEASGEVSVVGGSFAMVDGGLGSGQRHAVLAVDGPEARLAFRPARLDSYDANFLRFRVRKSHPGLRIRVGWEDSRGVVTVAAEGAPDPEGHQGWTLPTLRAAQVHDVLLDFADLSMPRTGPKIVPRSRVAEVFLEVRGGKRGERVEIDGVEFLRESRRPYHVRRNGLILAGRVTGASPRKVVYLGNGQARRVTVADEDGFFLFRDVEQNSVVSVWTERADGKRRYPAIGERFRATSDRADLDL